MHLDGYDLPIRQARAARQMVQVPWIQDYLRRVVYNEDLPAISLEAIASLLDLAILIADLQAALCLAKKCKLMPWRRWRSSDFWRSSDSQTYYDFELHNVVRVALLAGVGLQNLQTQIRFRGREICIPFSQALLAIRSELTVQLIQEGAQMIPATQDTPYSFLKVSFVLSNTFDMTLSQSLEDLPFLVAKLMHSLNQVHNKCL